MGSVKSLDFSSYPRRKRGRIETGYFVYAGLSGENIGPRIWNGVTDRRNHAQSGDDYPTLGQDVSDWDVLEAN